ncbi:MAG: prephenate dehydrogenase [Bacteroidota bacterium]
MKKVLLVGVGLINGSFALALRNKVDLTFAGYDISEENLASAKGKGLISQAFSLKGGLKWADLILLGTPVDSIKDLLPGILSDLEKNQLVVDFGSTKTSICEAVEDHPNRNQFLAAHPIAGTENSGPGAAFASLYQNQNLIICEKEKTDNLLAEDFLGLAKAAGFYFTFMSAEEHDRHLAYISHLSHISSFVLSNTVLQKEKDGEVILDLAGSGFESTVRLAKSSPNMWGSIFHENKRMVLASIEAYQQELEILRVAIESEDRDRVSKYLEEGRKIRKILS